MLVLVNMLKRIFEEGILFYQILKPLQVFEHNEEYFPYKLKL